MSVGRPDDWDGIVSFPGVKRRRGREKLFGRPKGWRQSGKRSEDRTFLSLDFTRIRVSYFVFLHFVSDGGVQVGLGQWGRFEKRSSYPLPGRSTFRTDSGQGTEDLSETGRRRVSPTSSVRRGLVPSGRVQPRWHQESPSGTVREGVPGPRPTQQCYSATRSL